MTDEEEEWEERTYFIGPCKCPENCPNYDDNEKHSWGACDGELPDGTVCPCEAGWEE
jgi:hypothetical protein